MIFKDRQDAGIQLAAKLKNFQDQADTIVMGLARGGVIVAYEIAKALHLPLGVSVVRKVGAPGNEELALGAVTATGQGVFNDHLISMLGVSKEFLKKQVEKEKEKAKARTELYQGARQPPSIKGKTVILVDDGIATGASVRAAIVSLKTEGAAKIILAVPVAALDALNMISKEVDQIYCLYQPSIFEAVGFFYKRFEQVEDAEIIQILKKKS